MVILISEGLCKKQADEAEKKEEGEEGRQDAEEGVAKSLEGETEGRGGQKQGGGIANDFTSSCGTWLEREKGTEGKELGREGEEGRNSGRGNKMGFEILLMERK